MWNVVGGVCGQWYHSESGSYICVCGGGGGEVHRVQPEPEVVKPMPRALAQALQWGCNVSASDSELQVESSGWPSHLRSIASPLQVSLRLHRLWGVWHSATSSSPVKLSQCSLQLPLRLLLITSTASGSFYKSQ